MVDRIAAILTVALLFGGGISRVSHARGACDEMSRLARTACVAGVTDDFSIGKGNCVNLADTAARQQCVADARDARTEAQQLCRDQSHARQDLCDALGQDPYDPAINPNEFLTPQVTAANPNPYFPLVPGTTRVFKGGGETDTVTVTNQTKVYGANDPALGTVGVTLGGLINNPAISTWNGNGAVWYFGEITQSMSEDGLISTDGSFLAGVDGAKAGIIMQATPQVGEVYRQEFSLGNAEDAAEVTSTTGSASVPGASCSGNCVVTREFTPLEPDGDEQKFYAAGIGVILDIDPDGTRSELQ
jgi:hypothetical protein